MRTPRVLLATALLTFAALPVSGQSQSLADAAAQAAKIPHDWPLSTADAAKVYTNADLQAAPTPSGAPAVSMAAMIRAKCAVDWLDDFRMRAFCETQQTTALAQIQARTALMQTSPSLQAIRAKCLRDWSTRVNDRNGQPTYFVDFKMDNFCEEQQLKAAVALSR